MSTRRPNLEMVNKKQRTCRIGEIAIPADHRVKLKEGEKRDKYLDLARELKKTKEFESGDGPNDSTVMIGQNTKKSPGGLRRLAVTHTPVKDHQLLLV